MSDAYKIKDQTGLYFLTLQIVDWVDLFTRKIYRDIVIESFEYCIRHKGLRLFGYVIMSNHIHLIASVVEGYKLSDVLRDLKKITSKRFLEHIKIGSESRRDWMLKRFEFASQRHLRNHHFQIWTHDNHAIELKSERFISQKLNYIHQNPVRAGIIANPEDYLYSSASNYAGLPSIITVEFLIFRENPV